MVRVNNKKLTNFLFSNIKIEKDELINFFFDLKKKKLFDQFIQTCKMFNNFQNWQF